ncbi:MAG: N-acetyltransferase, partial [Bacteroidales bacterium]
KIAASQNINVLIGIITGTNKPSIALFETCGYEKCAHFRQVGEKFGKVLDVVGYQKILGQ